MMIAKMTMTTAYADAELQRNPPPRIPADEVRDVRRSGPPPVITSIASNA
jgi:hypothetical protein